MGRQFFEENILLRRLSANSDGLTFLFGSALSVNKGVGGIPDVSQVSEIIKDYADELNLLEEYEDFIERANGKDRYQESFSFMSAVHGAPSIREIVKRIVMRNYDEKTGQHLIPKAIQDFVRCIRDGKIKIKNILTTNFDTLIEEAFKNEGIAYNSISTVSDSNIQENSNGYINIVHLHGVWDRGDTMHTKNQLESKRDRVEASLRHYFTEQHIVIMAYGGWDDSFTRTLTNIVKDDKADYNLAWCFYQKEDGVIDRDNKEFFDDLESAISRDRIHFFKGIDCNNVFSGLLDNVLSKKKEPRKLNGKKVDEKKHDEVNYYLIEEKRFCKNIREDARRKSIKTLNESQSLFIEAGLGFGLYGFISSLISTVENKKTKCLKVDLSDVISKNQVDDKVKSDTGHHLASLIFTLGLDNDILHFIIFDRIRDDADIETLLYLLKLPETSNSFGGNIFFIYSSSVYIRQFAHVHVELIGLSLHETGIILREEFGDGRFTHNEIYQIHDQSEGVVAKLEKIMYFLDNSSAQEVLSQYDIFDNVFHSECIPSTTLKQIDLLINDPSKASTLKMLKILSILKNGETLSNLRKDKLGLNLSPRNTKELISFELATTLYIDNTTTIIRINPIIKDYVLSKMSQDEKFEISSAYLRVAVIETQEGVKLSSVNRKIYDNGYNTEEDNTNTLIKYSIQECKANLSRPGCDEDFYAMQQRRLSKLLHLARSYVYILSSSSRFGETISAVGNLLAIIEDVDPSNLYEYYHYIAYAHRMKSNSDEARHYLGLCELLCPESNKGMKASIYMEKLHMLEDENIPDAINFAKEGKSRFHKNSSAYILSETIIAHEKGRVGRINSLEFQEKKARKLGYHTLANNILFVLNKERNDIDKLRNLDKILSTDPSAYNFCRATIYKNEVLVRNGSFDKIKDSDVVQLTNIYNYLFRQKFDILFRKCHKALWEIAEQRKNKELIFLIFYKGTIVWRLTSDSEYEERYKTRISGFERDEHKVLLGNLVG